MNREKIQMLWEIIEKQIGSINTSQNYYKESIEHLHDYEFICNCCLEIFETYRKLNTSNYYSDRQIGEYSHAYLLELKEWLDDLLEV